MTLITEIVDLIVDGERVSGSLIPAEWKYTNDFGSVDLTGTRIKLDRVDIRSILLQAVKGVKVTAATSLKKRFIDEAEDLPPSLSWEELIPSGRRQGSREALKAALEAERARLVEAAVRQCRNNKMAKKATLDFVRGMFPKELPSELELRVDKVFAEKEKETEPKTVPGPKTVLKKKNKK